MRDFFKKIEEDKKSGVMRAWASSEEFDLFMEYLDKYKHAQIENLADVPKSKLSEQQDLIIALKALIGQVGIFREEAKRLGNKDVIKKTIGGIIKKETS